ncbi:uncharacterized protein HD556DRAFT_1440480 [Suillus plorans]|uniref:Uncharacterized protein n=1 Tax=Suillus plorans TaxID=116603 RepID=A0A9P7AB26_9AGAM|nr:uncharacterized protein HD556DRAFT_1451330 [Suillus plorans]XP_041157550.1 uncharacterized protein HD556DRAFT_1446111 [Suillus plorans]XP_041162952.1 uncharacterized protein HD556DRAFT_1440480 [Suillus plorans]KAG1784880.1 hypothetical protein HD556DRAFT_1451330 [Suillus plorans]KAG1790588.1 hypothetical protein HD556DRAFT_1446111 [Suillus plorans]KAG1798141.1 hypothetical protein HD556DRAFT_1440480 [Suillus plorans]
MNQSIATPPASEPSSQNRRHAAGTVTRTWTRRTVQTRSHRTVTRTKTTVDATETKTVSEKTRKVDSDITQAITGPSNIPAVLNTDITIPSLTQDFPRDNSPSPTDSTFTQTPPTTPSSSSSSISSARSSDVLWDQLEDLSEYMNAVSLG